MDTNPIIKKAPEAVDPQMMPSPTMKVIFTGGEVVTMNRRERRRRGLYGVGLRPVRS